jgi:hypothetical protein
MSALAEALVAAQAELPTAIGKDSDGLKREAFYTLNTVSDDG